MRFSPFLFLAVLCLASTENAHAVLKCRLAYLPDAFKPGTSEPMPEAPEVVVSNPKSFQQTPNGLVASFAADGVIRNAFVVFQQDSPNGTGTLTVHFDAASQRNPALDAIYDYSIGGYSFGRADPVQQRMMNVNGDINAFVFDTRPTKPTPPLTFVGPGDFPSDVIGKLKGHMIVQVDVTCQNER